jgi:MFS family permease
MDESTEDQGPTTVEKIKGLPWGVAWSVTNSVFAQYTFFGSIFILFLNELDLDTTQIGGLLSLLPFFGIIAVFITPAVARFGYKRVFVASFLARTTTAGFLLLTPLIAGRYGQQGILVFVIATVAAFSLFRAAGFTAFYPWLQEQVPDAMRGKYTAVKNVLASLATLLATLAAGYVLGTNPDLGQFTILIGSGVALGYVSIWTSTRIPGGAPRSAREGEAGSYREMIAAVRDSGFVRYLIGLSLVTMATVPLISFVPLFMKEEVGLSPQHVVWLDTGILLGGLVSSYLWGWLADRYGSKPVMISGVYLLPLLPIAWLLMPRHSAWSLYLALAIAFGEGLINTGWTIGSGRLLYVGLVPVEKKTGYMALYYAWIGIAGGIGQLLGGLLVDVAPGTHGQWWIVRFDPYTPLFLAALVFSLVGYLLLRSVRADSTVTARQFAGMFMRGNPFVAMESMVRYHRARDERATVAMTERLGSTRSPLAVEELIEALQDPRFFVRFEAIVSMARHGSDPRLTEALIETLEGDEPALSTVAAWALGRTGDERALEALRRGLNARYRSVQAHCARSLGNLDDTAAVPILLDRLSKEKDIGLQLALGAAVGQLGAIEATGPLLALLRTAASTDARNEFALALARLVGREHSFVQLQRQMRSEAGTALSQAVTALGGRLARSHQSHTALERALSAAAEALAHEELLQGINLLREALDVWPSDSLAPPCSAIVRECAARLDEFGAQRLEYAILALEALDYGL